jgi:hypothetical protein
MNIEPLKSILEWSSNKKETLLYYLSNNVKEKVKKLELEEEKIYVQDRIFCIKKNTLELEYDGTVLYIENDRIGLKISNVKTVRLNPDDYYIFVRCKKTISKQRVFMKQLLEQL